MAACDVTPPRRGTTSHIAQTIDVDKEFIHIAQKTRAMCDVPHFSNIIICLHHVFDRTKNNIAQTSHCYYFTYLTISSLVFRLYL